MWPLIVLKNPASTQDIALQFARTNSYKTKIVYFSASQTDGYGTNSRKWISAESSFAASFVFPFSVPNEQQSISAFPIFLAILSAQILEKIAIKKKYSIGIKWPNDLYKNGKKCGGLIMHSLPYKIKKKQMYKIVLGMGINLAWKTPPVDLNASAIFESFDDSVNFDPVSFIELITISIENFILENRTTDLIHEFSKRDIFKSETLKISQKNKRVIIGKNMAINHQGRLLVQEKNKTELTEIYSGSIECV